MASAITKLRNLWTSPIKFDLQLQLIHVSFACKQVDSNTTNCITGFQNKLNTQCLFQLTKIKWCQHPKGKTVPNSI